MSRKLTKKEIEERKVLRVIERIKNIEKDYGIEITRHSAQRYANSRREEIRLNREIKEKERELLEMKTKKR